MIHCLTNLFFHVSLASPGTQQQACPSSRQGDVASQPHLSGEEWGRPALRPNHPGKRMCHPRKGELGSPLSCFACCTTQLGFHLQHIWLLGLSHLQASFRGDGKSPGVPQKPCSKAAAPTPPKRRNSTLWSETLDVHQKGTFSTKEIKRQEVRISTETCRNGKPVVPHS